MFSVNSNLGVSPISSLPYVVSQILGTSLGTCTTVIYCFYIFLQILICGKDFRPILLLEIVFSTVFGYFVDTAKGILGDFMIPTYFGQLAMLAISICLISIGLVLHIDAQLVPMAAEGLVDCIAKKLDKPFPSIKTIFDCTSVLVGTVLCFLFLGKLVGIREGTIIAAILVGKVMGIVRKRLAPIIQKICF